MASVEKKQSQYSPFQLVSIFVITFVIVFAVGAMYGIWTNSHQTTSIHASSNESRSELKKGIGDLPQVRSVETELILY